MHRYLHSVEDFLGIDDEYVARASRRLGAEPMSRRPRDHSDDGDDDDFDDYDDDLDEDFDSDEDADYDYDDRDDDRY